MDASPSALLNSFVPALPNILLTSVLAILNLTPNSSDQDAITQIIVAAARPVLRTPAALGRSQRVWRTIGEWSVWVFDWLWRLGLGWICGMNGIREVSWERVRVSIDDGNDVVKASLENGEVKEDEDGTMVMSVRSAIEFAFTALQDPKHKDVACPIPTTTDVEVEWIHRRHKSDSSSLFPVILYFHGGAHCLMDPTTHRFAITRLSSLSDADICSVRFRQAPQHPFPAALIDSFVAYLNLLVPATNDNGILRAPIDPSRIVIAGDSSGGGLAASLLLLLLTLARNRVSILHNGSVVRIPSPPCAGLALTSAWLDITRSLPSTSRNDRWDMIAPPPVDSASPPFPVDEVWPTKPPRAETYCAAEICTHPLVSPLAARPEMWVGTPPVWLCSGWEGFTDEMEVFARRVWMSDESAEVTFEGWEGMPHCFGFMPWNWAGEQAFQQWAGFCAEAVARSGKGGRRSDVAGWTATKGKFRGVRREVRIDQLGCEMGGVGYVREFELTDDVVDELMEKGRDWRIGLEREMVRLWKQGDLKKSSLQQV